MKMVSPISTGVAALAILSIVNVSAQTIVLWDGGDPAAPNDSGNWSNAINWDSGALPQPTERAVLPSVTDGSTRTVTLDTAQSVDSVQILQSDVTGVNKLSLGADLTLSTTNFLMEPTGGATASQIQVDLNGHGIHLTGTNGTLGVGTINFNTDGSIFQVHQVANAHWIYNIDSTLNSSAAGAQWLATWDPLTSLQHSGNGTINLRAGSSLNITAGDFTIGASRVAGTVGQARVVTLNNSGMISTAAGTIFQLQSEAVSLSNSSRSLALNNNASVNHSGTMQFQPSSSGTGTASISINNNSSWTVSGGGTVIKRMTTTNDDTDIATPTFSNNIGGILRGNSASDTLEYNEEVATLNRMMLTNDGSIQAGAGSQGSGLTSVGNFTFRDIDMTNGATGTIELDIGGVTLGEYDKIILLNGLTDPAGAGSLDLSAGGTLQLWSVNGFAPSSEFTISLIDANIASGVFTTVKLDGNTFTGNELDIGGGLKYLIGYESDSITLSLVPEPQTYALIAGLFCAFVLLKRRRVS